MSEAPVSAFRPLATGPLAFARPLHRGRGERGYGEGGLRFQGRGAMSRARHGGQSPHIALHGMRTLHVGEVSSDDIHCILTGTHDAALNQNRAGA